MADARFYKGAPLPRTLGLCVDEYHEVREIRLAMQKEVDEVEQREKEIQAYVIENLSKTDEKGAVGKLYLGKIEEKPEPKLSDWPTFCKYVAANERFDLLQKRVTKQAVTDMWDANEAVPGVERVWVPKLSVTKL